MSCDTEACICLQGFFQFAEGAGVNGDDFAAEITDQTMIMVFLWQGVVCFAVLTDRTDEDNLGFTYAALDKYIRTGVCEDETVKAKIDRLHVMNEFKLKPIPCFEYEA